MSFSSGTRGKEPTCQFRGHKRRRSDPWVGKQPTPVFCLENPMDRGASWPTVHRVSEFDTTERLTLSLHFIYMIDKWS